MRKKYTVDYASGATGYGWSEEFDRLEEFEDFIKEMRSEYTARVTVWDNELGDFVFWKDVLTYECRIDMLKSYDRDFRTTTRRIKEQAVG